MRYGTSVPRAYGGASVEAWRTDLTRVAWELANAATSIHGQDPTAPEDATMNTMCSTLPAMYLAAPLTLWPVVNCS